MYCFFILSTDIKQTVLFVALTVTTFPVDCNGISGSTGATEAAVGVRTHVRAVVRIS